MQLGARHDKNPLPFFKGLNSFKVIIRNEINIFLLLHLFFQLQATLNYMCPFIRKIDNKYTT